MRSKASSMNALRRQKMFWGYFFITPQVIGLLIFAVIPIIAAFTLSFFEWSGLSDATFVGFRNYIEEFESEDLRKAIINTLYYSLLTIPVGISISLFLALALKNIQGKLIYRMIFFAPVVTSSVAVSMVWMWLFNGDFGIINTLLSTIGITGPQWLTDTDIVMVSIAIMSIWWGAGHNMVLFLAGLQGIPSVYYEAAKIDGANSWQQFTSITIPLLSPTVFFITIMTIIGSFQVFDQTFIMTNGGPAKASYTVVFHIFENAFQFFKMGIATTAAVILFLMILAVTLVQFYFSNKWVYYEG